MNKRERVLAAFEGRRVDRVPFTMWRHAFLQSQTAQGLAQLTHRFYQDYDLDLIVMNPYPFYMAEAWGSDVQSFGSDTVMPYIVSPLVERATDWRHLPELEVEGSSLAREVEAVRQVRGALGKEDAPLLISIYSPLTTADMLAHGRVLQDMRSFSNDLRGGLQVIAAVTGAFARACLEAGADGVLMVNRLAGRDMMRPREYRDFAMVYDVLVFDDLPDTALRALHLDVEQPDLGQVDHYPVHVVCWPTWRCDPSLSAALGQFRGTLMGGLNPMAFSSGSVADLREQVSDAIAQTGGWRLVVAPSGALPVDARPDLLAAMPQVIADLR